MAKSTSKTSKASKPKKRNIRFEPDPNTVAQVHFILSGRKNTTILGLVLNESQSGFAALFYTPIKLKEGMVATCRVGQLPDTTATIRWFKTLEKNVVKVGFEYS